MDIKNDALEVLEKTANFMRGMCFDPRLHPDIKLAISERVSEIDDFADKYQKVAVPEGFVVVPREPTKQQIDYVVDQMRLSGGLDMVEQIYKAMIEAQESTHD